MFSTIEATHKTARSPSVTSTSSSNSESLELNSGFLELTMPNHHRTTSSSLTSQSGGFLQLTPTISNNQMAKPVLIDADERQRLLLLRARNL
ncbi:hypothetical protein GcM3_218039 [Golovinomyces cichoracearum]|uniref:Uncharacterized protein n=1 Tax=Golovinomyces cichoracearum TaxID=62708 RepID=A0A420H7U4_9PEZI|nr:hypothetical protein GcM3_218039 [Golovinomyces cichoracearum]